MSKLLTLEGVEWIDTSEQIQEEIEFNNTVSESCPVGDWFQKTRYGVLVHDGFTIDVMVYDKSSCVELHLTNLHDGTTMIGRHYEVADEAGIDESLKHYFNILKTNYKETKGKKSLAAPGLFAKITKAVI